MLGLPWLALKNTATEEDLLAIRNFGATMRQTLEPFLARPKNFGLWLSSCALGVHGEIIYHRWRHHTIGEVPLQAAVWQWVNGNCTDPSSRCKWVEECDWTRQYERNLTMVKEGRLQKCMFKHQRWEIGLVVEFRRPGEKCEHPTLTTL
eukprot:NODE_942_length_1360_cov_154.228833_g785_i0.p3 GENE.NODE_942_length_1360_cov_154.228833_g785_i0~~NODE_942_length_1360_cov_154.228833_g785_i0.p3  ORF type:complete len:149 (+),score=44.86 NODE_942_length_1360_cov_154.228833_g785_i0:844-1290(+)